MAYKIDPEKCVACGACADVCGDAAIKPAGAVYKIDAALCVECGACAGTCPNDAIALATF